MPKRSNDFQRLIYLIKRQVVETAEVTESKFLIDRDGAQREVDICIEQNVGGHKVIISIECRDRSRKADISWVEQMKAKHEELPTNVLVLFSKNGFTLEAKKKAKNWGITTLELGDVNPASVDQLLQNIDLLWSKFFKIFPQKVIFGVYGTQEQPSEQVCVLPDNTIFLSSGEVVMTTKELVELFLNSQKVIQEIGSPGTEEHKWFSLRWDFPTIGDGVPLYLRKEQPYGLRQIEFIHIMGEIRFEVSEFPIAQGVLGDTKFAWGNGRFIGQDATLTATENESGERKLSIDIEKWEPQKVPDWLNSPLPFDD